jgi:hypothetical protein
MIGPPPLEEEGSQWNVELLDSGGPDDRADDSKPQPERSGLHSRIIDKGDNNTP